MKTTIRVFCTICCLVLCVSLSAQEKKAFPKEMMGKWSYSIENPESGEVMKGICTIAQKDDATKATFDMGQGGADTTPFRVNDNGKFYADLDIQGYVLGVTFTIVEGKLSCEMDAGGFIIPIELKKE